MPPEATMIDSSPVGPIGTSTGWPPAIGEPKVMAHTCAPATCPLPVNIQRADSVLPLIRYCLTFRSPGAKNGTSVMLGACVSSLPLTGVDAIGVGLQSVARAAPLAQSSAPSTPAPTQRLIARTRTILS